MVDDSESDVLLIIRELKKGGYNPYYERVETAAAMKKSLQEKQWDVILCDYKMPKFDASSAIALLKETNIDVPLIIISGTVGEETAVECMRLGAQDYIIKGNLFRLCPVIARELEESEVRNKQKQAESQREAVLEELHKNEEKYRTIIGNIQEGYFEIDLAGNFTFFNDSMCRCLGYSPKELIGMNYKKYTDEENAKNYLTLTMKPINQEQPAVYLNTKLSEKMELEGSWKALYLYKKIHQVILWHSEELYAISPNTERRRKR
jgi:PAS domain S-box-containing protein